ncbi:MAG TPA: glucokinase [Vicinamibacterales bacterium]
MILKSMTKLLLAGDVGGTKTLLGLFEPANPRPARLHARPYGTLDFKALPDMIDAFLRESGTPPDRISTASFGAAGPVIDRAATLTNVPWRVDTRDVANAFPFESVHLLNDLQAMAYSVWVLDDSELLVLQDGQAQPEGNIAIIAAGTGLGEALLHSMAGRRIPSPSEGGHADFAARTEREIALTRDLTRRYGRADVEHVISGRGLVNLHRICHANGCKAGVNLEDPSAPAAITAAALARSCTGCVEVLDMFVEAYGAEAGNLALRSVATGGVFIGGGIAPKIAPAMTNGSFMRAFRDKAPLDAMLRAMPVKMVMNEEAGLLGAAVYANSI